MVTFDTDSAFIQVKSDNRGTFTHARSEMTMAESNILPLLYATVTSGIEWFLLWFVYDVMKIRQFLKPLAFANLALAVCLIVFVILGGIGQLKKVLKR